MALTKEQIKMMALAERLMDEGRIPWVMAPSAIRKGEYERMPVSQNIMEELGLVSGQKINSIIFEHIVEASFKGMADLMEKFQKQAEEKEMDKNFDFRKLMDDGEPTKH